MALEHAVSEMIAKPWGSEDLRPWSRSVDGQGPIGEIWFQRPGDAARPALLLKLLFANARLSIQVHPDDEYAAANGLPNGKTEAWYVLSASERGEVAVGLKRKMTRRSLRKSMDEGAVDDCIQWRNVHEGETISVPAGTIHAIGAGTVIAEIQQRSDATYRIFDYGRDRPLQIDDAIAVATTRPSAGQRPPMALANGRTVLAASPYFVLERLDLAAGSAWQIDTVAETWLLVLEGEGHVGPLQAAIGGAFFLEADPAEILPGAAGLSLLMAYVGSTPAAGILTDTYRIPAKGGAHLRADVPSDQPVLVAQP